MVDPAMNGRLSVVDDDAPQNPPKIERRGLATTATATAPTTTPMPFLATVGGKDTTCNGNGNGNENTSKKKNETMMMPPASPKQPSKCPLFCCFVSEFDDKKGPILSFQSPKGFMDQDISVSTDTIQSKLQETFDELMLVDGKSNSTGNSGNEKGPETKLEPEPEAAGTWSTPPASITTSEKEGTTKRSVLSREGAGNSTSTLCMSETDDLVPEPVPVSLKDKNEDGNPEIVGGLSIFDSTSEYIITGSELTSKSITVSTHAFHILTRPTLISNTRYERNTLLFSVCFVLRRAADPRPFRPLLTKVAAILEAMEQESQFMTAPKTRPQLQPFLEHILLSLNSAEWECNLPLNPSNALHLKLYHPPKPDTSPVQDYQVPVLLRRDLQLQMYDWDLAINWVILHIDGVATTKQISMKAEVDLEMVRACLRVLKHHGVIALVCPFSYSNRYEFTPRATAVLAGRDRKLLQECWEFCAKQPTGRGDVGMSPTLGPNSTTTVQPTSVGSDSNVMPLPHLSASPFLGSIPSASYPPRGGSMYGSFCSNHNNNSSSAAGNTSYRYALMAAQSLEREPSSSYMGYSTSATATVQYDQRVMQSALAELYCACNRHLSFGDLWTSLTYDVPATTTPTTAAEATTTSTSTLLTMPNLHSQNNAANRSYLATTGKNRKGSISEKGPSKQDGMALSPSESWNLEGLRNKASNSGPPGDIDNTKSSKLLLDWTDFFQRIDHRRFCTFGTVHGLLTRVHNYPCFPYPIAPLDLVEPPGLHPIDFFMAGTSSATASSTAAPGQAETATATATATTTATTGTIAATKQHAQYWKRKEQHEMAMDIVTQMDGTRCDDELASIFERPLRRLTKLVEHHGKRRVLALYAERPLE